MIEVSIPEQRENPFTRLRINRRAGIRQNPREAISFLASAILGSVENDIADVSNSRFKLKGVLSIGNQSRQFRDDNLHFSHCYIAEPCRMGFIFLYLRLHISHSTITSSRNTRFSMTQELTAMQIYNPSAERRQFMIEVLPRKVRTVIDVPPIDLLKTGSRVCVKVTNRVERRPIHLRWKIESAADCLRTARRDSKRFASAEQRYGRIITLDDHRQIAYRSSAEVLYRYREQPIHSLMRRWLIFEINNA